jgi:hypothetical protein
VHLFQYQEYLTRSIGTYAIPSSGRYSNGYGMERPTIAGVLIFEVWQYLFAYCLDSLVPIPIRLRGRREARNHNFVVKSGNEQRIP